MKPYLSLLIAALICESLLNASYLNVDPQKEDTDLHQEQIQGPQYTEDQNLQQEQIQGPQFFEDQNLQQEQTQDFQFKEDQNFQQERELGR